MLGCGEREENLLNNDALLLPFEQSFYLQLFPRVLFGVPVRVKPYQEIAARALTLVMFADNACAPTDSLSTNSFDSTVGVWCWSP